MYLRLLASLSLLAPFFHPQVVSAADHLPSPGIQNNVHAPNAHYHHSVISRRLKRDSAAIEDNVPVKRAANARFSNYVAGLGACGTYNSNSEFVVALNRPQWDGGSHCYEMVTLTFGGKTTQAQIVDECMGCPENGLDLSQGLYSFFSDNGGVVYGDWEYVGASPDPPKSSTTTSTTSTPPPPPKTTTTTKSTIPPAPSTTSHSTSKVVPSTTSTTSTTSTSSSSNSSTTSSTPTSTSSATPTSTSSEILTPTLVSSTTSSAPPAVSTLPLSDPQILNQLDYAMILLGGLIVAGATST